MIIKLDGLNKSYSEHKRSGIPKARKPCNLALIVFFTTHPNLLFLWHYGRNFQATTGDCKLAAPIKFIGATNFLDLVTTLENLGAKCLIEKKVNFVPCCYNNFCGNLPVQHTLYHSDIEVTASF